MLKELRDKKRRLEEEARQKLTSITASTTEEQQRAVEQEHADLLAQIAEVAEAIARAEEDETRAGKKRKGVAKKRKGKSGKSTDAEGDDSDDDDDSDDESDDSDDQDNDGDGESDSDRRKRKKRKAKNSGDDDDAGDGDRAAGSILSRSAMAEMALIDSQARGLGVELGSLADAITRNETPDAMRKRMFDELAKRSKANGPTGNASHIEFGRDERDGRSVAMEIALITRMLKSRGGREAIEYKPQRPEELALVEKHRGQAQQYMGMGLVEIAAECLGYRGNIRTPHQAYEIMQRAFQSTSDYPSIFLNVLNKALLARYELAMPTYREIAIERPFNDFRPHPQIRAGEFPQLQPVKETGEIEYGSSFDNNESVSVAPYGVVFSISRQMLVNDDLGAIDQILGSAGDTVMVFENTTFFQMFLANAAAGPVLNQDSLNVFTTGAIAAPGATPVGHNNLVASGSGAAPSVTTIASARQALREMKSLTGLYLNVPPRIILTGPAQETSADQMVASITPTLTTSVNPFSGRLRSISDANIVGSQWYLFCEPGRVPCFVYGFLNGANGPRVRTFEPFGVQGVKISLEHDFGCGAIDYRGCFENYGS